MKIVTFLFFLVTSEFCWLSGALSLRIKARDASNIPQSDQLYK